MHGGSADTLGQKPAGRWLGGLPLPVFPDVRSATPAEIERWRQTLLPDISADLRLVRLIAVDIHHVVAGGSIRVTTKPFIPTDRQRKILDLLKGKVNNLSQLATLLGVKESTISGRFVRELREQGRVDYNWRIGSDRPDAPPPELALTLQQLFLGGGFVTLVGVRRVTARASAGEDNDEKQTLPIH